MPAIFEWTHQVGDADLDDLGHANNISYLKWMQSAAIAHSAEQGWPAQAYKEVGCGWVVRSHQIEYLYPAKKGDFIVVRTWIADMKKATSLRRFLIYRPTDGKETILAKSATDWAFIDYKNGMPKRILPEVAQAFEIVTDMK